MKWICDSCYTSKPCILDDNEPFVEDTPDCCPYGFDGESWDLYEEEDK